MKFTKIKSLFLSICLIQASYSAERFHENGFVQPHLLAETIEKNREFFLNHKFVDGETLINLMPIDYIDPVQVEQDGFGSIRTLHVLNGWNITFKQYGSWIAPLTESSEENLRLNRLDGQGFAKEEKDGSTRLGTLNLRKSTPIQGSPFSTVALMNLSEELHLHNEGQQRQRRPEDLRGKEFSKRKPLVPHIPTPEELQEIVESKKASRQDQLTKLSSKFGSLNLELLKDTESLTKIKTLKFGLSFLQNKIDNETLFNSSFKNLEKNVSELQQSILQELRRIHSQSISTSDFSTSSFDTGALTKETKEEADHQILKLTKKEESRLNRSNANPSGKEEAAEEQEKPELEKTPVPPYIFQNPLNHGIVDELKGTSNEDSSYTGINISRKRLENFVEFLKDEELKEREEVGENISKDLLRYYYATDQGDGSHIKVKLGYGIKPIILSQQGNWLTVPQLKDLKAAIEQKGLL